MMRCERNIEKGSNQVVFVKVEKGENNMFVIDTAIKRLKGMGGGERGGDMPCLVWYWKSVW